ncbi:hypothetical protein EDD33_1803 [Nocardioides aurantiacus]|uniref:Uncharacterized protein n=2 Tax=Nocardioides aurantiacus TaxID=86796 RepID=A0A3N2CU09_9ACTN|nr:hypothetical protein EDD33_1803 [Nocardioides aurantiacus]
MCVLVTGCGFTPFGSDHTQIVADKKGVALNLKRLSVAVDDLNAVKDPTNTRSPRPASASGCAVDSGEVFEPEADQDWELSGPALSDVDLGSKASLSPTPAAQRAMEAIADQLIDRGWAGRARVVRDDDDGAYFIDLRRVYADHQIRLGLQGFSDEILAYATTTLNRLCRGAHF